MMHREHPQTEPTDHELLRRMAKDISWIRTVVVAVFVLGLVGGLIAWASYQP